MQPNFSLLATIVQSSDEVRDVVRSYIHKVGCHTLFSIAFTANSKTLLLLWATKLITVNNRV